MAVELFDGVYYSKNKPELVEEDLFDEDNLASNSYFCRPYQTDTVIIWHGEKPKKLNYEGQANYGASLYTEVLEKGYITVCMEND